jgi:thymidylate synthase (FAD)
VNSQLLRQVDVLDKGFVRLYRYSGTDVDIANAARTSYQAETSELTTKDERLIDRLMRDQHTSPFEFVQFYFVISAPIFVARQWMRHRTFTFNEWSGRYTTLPDEAYLPEQSRLQLQSRDNKQGSDAHVITDSEVIRERMELEQKFIFDNYADYTETGLAKELTRINLPLSTYTQFRASIDLHNLLHFLRLRLDPHAQHEIRVYADAILELIRPIVPATIRSFENHVVNSVKFSGDEMDILRVSLSAKGLEHALLNQRHDSKLSLTRVRELMRKFGVYDDESEELLFSAGYLIGNK